MKILYDFAYGMCHQLPERSFQVVNFTLPFCARCSGVYWGFLSGFIGMYLIGRKNKGLPVSILRWFSILLLILFPAEVLIEKFLPFSIPLFVRTYIGIGFGVSASLYLVPLFNHFFWHNKGEIKHVLNNPLIFVTILLMSIGIFEFCRFSTSIFLGYLLGIFSVIGTILLYLILNLTIISSIPRFRRFPNNRLTGFLLSLLLGMIEIILIKTINGKMS